MNLVELLINLVLAIPMAIWFYKDARARDYMWYFWVFVPLILIFSSTIITIVLLLILLVCYIMFRPKGNLFKCPHCQKAVLEELFVCPFCRKNAKRECLNCHEPVPWEADQCPKCKSRSLTKE